METRSRLSSGVRRLQNTMMTRIFSVLIAILLGSRPAGSQATDTKPCGVAFGQSLVVFVGKKLDVRPFTPTVPDGHVLLDNAFRARYRVLQYVCGNLPAQEIEFEAYDHYGSPAFAEFDTVLLFVSWADGRLVHQKYQYVDVYETSDGSWAGCGDPYRLEPEVHRGAIRAKPMAFKRPVSFSVRDLNQAEIRRRYPPEFFERTGDTVTCRAGTPLADLYAIKRNGVLKARGIFQ